MKYNGHYILDVYSAYKDKLDVPDLMAIEEVCVDIKYSHKGPYIVVPTGNKVAYYAFYAMCGEKPIKIWVYPHDYDGRDHHNDALIAAIDYFKSEFPDDEIIFKFINTL